ncbi:MAG: MFS transporter [Chloroflexi bacterium]|nr:MFS transporter [Chloroflexota bacterium]
MIASGGAGAPIRLPFFYGWVVVGVGFLIAFSSGPGQSYVFSVFLDSIIEDTGLSRTTISVLYAVGTGVSAVMVAFVSRLADRVGPRLVAVAVASALGVACIGMAFARGFAAFFLAFAALRALGQGSTPINATLLTAQWFVLRRGRAMAVMGLGLAASLALLPPISRALIDAIGWREAYVGLGVMVWLLVIPATLLLARDTPEQLGLHPDGRDRPPPREAVMAAGAEERRVFSSLTFWLLALPLTTSPFVVTALVFHQAGIFAERGLGAGVAAAVFVPFALTTALSSTLAGFAVDRLGPIPLFLLSMLLLLAALGSSRLIESAPSAVLYAGVLGTSSGVQRIVQSVLWAHYYGRRGLGRVQGSATSIMILMSALGPLPLAVLEGASGSYGPGIAAMAALPVLASAGMLLARLRTPALEAGAGGAG